MKIKYFILSVLSLLVVDMSGQDFHNSYFQYAPIVINPAFTGTFYGNMRIQGIGRTQGNAVANQNGTASNNGFNDISAAVEVNVPFGLKKTDWVALGINYSDSKSGQGRFQRKFTGLSLAYHLSLNKKQTKVFTIGAKYGTYDTQLGRRDGLIDPDGLASGGGSLSQDLNRFVIDPDNNNNNTATDVNDITIGFLYTTPMGKEADLRIGLSVNHITAPRFRAGGAVTQPNPNPNPNPNPTPINTNNRLNRLINASIQYYVSLNDKVVFNPNLLYYTTEHGSQLLLQSMFSMLVNPEKEFILNAGIGIRPSSSMDIPLYLGADWKDWSFGFAYDTNVTALVQENSTAGAMELTVSKIIKWKKPANVDPKFVCPRL